MLGIIEPPQQKITSREFLTVMLGLADVRDRLKKDKLAKRRARYAIRAKAKRPSNSKY